jgi:chemotaxis protein MotB
LAKKQHHEEHENHERWLVSYADFITLLFAFFVVLYSVSRVDNKRMAQVVHAIKFAMHFKGTGGVGELPIFEGPPSEGGCVANMGVAAKPSPEKSQAAEAIRRRLEKKLREFLASRADHNPIVVFKLEGRKLIIKLSASKFFDPSQAAIRPEVIPVLDAIASELAPLHRPLTVEGHTDDSPVSTARFRDNWELSASRAAAVASYLQHAHHIDGKLLSAAGFGATRPVAANATAAGREANRRVEMAIEIGTNANGAGIGQ